MGTMMVWLPRLMALWSEGPAPPLRARPGPARSDQRSPSDCSSAKSCDKDARGRDRSGKDRLSGVVLAVRNKGSDRFMCQGSCFSCDILSDRRHGGVGLAIDDQRQQLGAAVVTDAVHHALALRDQGEIEIGHHHALAVL